MIENNPISEITLSYGPQAGPNDMPLLNNSAGTYEFVRSLFPENQITLLEQFIVVYLNASNRIIGCYRHSTGGITGTVADIRIILGVALKCAATGLILTHNHPSGSLRPSKADVDLTLKIRDAAKLMDIRLLDHIIVSGWGGYYSFADEGEL